MNKQNEIALFLACYKKHIQNTAKYAFSKLELTLTLLTLANYTSLHAAVYTDRCTNETLQEIIDHEVQLDYQTNVGKTALLLACSYRQQESVNILLEAGSNPNIVDTNGDTCLHAAVRERLHQKYCSRNN